MAKLNRSGPATSPAWTVTSIEAAVVVVTARAVVVAPIVLVTAWVVVVTMGRVDVDEVVVAVAAPPLHAVTVSIAARSQPILVRMRRR
jgi:hypothetical protein